MATLAPKLRKRAHVRKDQLVPGRAPRVALDLPRDDSAGFEGAGPIVYCVRDLDDSAAELDQI